MAATDEGAAGVPATVAAGGVPATVAASDVLAATEGGVVNFEELWIVEVAGRDLSIHFVIAERSHVHTKTFAHRERSVKIIEAKIFGKNKMENT